jgi:hypothetical protein
MRTFKLKIDLDGDAFQGTDQLYRLLGGLAECVGEETPGKDGKCALIDDNGNVCGYWEIV